MKVHITQILMHNGEGEPKDAHREKIGMWWMDGSVWMTQLMMFSETLLVFWAQSAARGYIRAEFSETNDSYRTKALCHYTCHGF